VRLKNGCQAANAAVVGGIKGKSMKPWSGSVVPQRIAKEYGGVPLDMSRIRPECPGSAHVLLRQEPDEEDNEEEDEGDDKEEDDDEGYSE
jgi:hypothetical protein